MTRAEYVYGISLCLGAAGLGTAAYLFAGGTNLAIPALFFGIVIVGTLASLFMRLLFRGMFK